CLFLDGKEGLTQSYLRGHERAQAFDKQRLVFLHKWLVHRGHSYAEQFLKSGDAGIHLVDAIVKEGAASLLCGKLANLPGRGIGENELLQARRDFDEFKNADASLVAGEIAD